MTIKIAYCDDEKEQLERFQKYIELFQVQTDYQCEAQVYNSGEILLQKYSHCEKPYDIVILDMMMQGMNGMETAKRIRQYQKSVIIIFMTSFPKYMQDSFSVQTFQYLIKPVEYERLKEELVRAINYIREDKDHFWVCRTDNEKRVIKYKDILYIMKETGMAEMKVCTLQGEFHAKGNLNDIEYEFEDNGFARVHRSILVNMRFIYRFLGNEIELDNGTKVPISRRKLQETKERFTRFTVKGANG